MPELTVRRTGNSLAVVIPRALVERLNLRPGDRVLVELERTPALEEFDGVLRGKATADELSREADEGEESG
jgi:antitoxin component of MazEF toxin-antitoxin module